LIEFGLLDLEKIKKKTLSLLSPLGKGLSPLFEETKIHSSRMTCAKSG
jgi:hypothetical protein